MRIGRCKAPLLTYLVLGLAVAWQPAAAQIVLSQPSFEAGQNYAAFFRVEHGCDGSPTLALSIRIPEGVRVIDTPEKPGWTLNASRRAGQIATVTWRGRLAADVSDQFGLFLKLPPKAGALYFPAMQECEKGETQWNGIPSAGHDLRHPAPVLRLIGASARETQTPGRFMAGDIMVEQPWAPATPGGATTAAVYMSIMNHGKSADTLTGGSSSAGKLEVHEMSMTGGVMRMRPLSGGLPIPAGGTVSLDPQGKYHFMLTGLKAPLSEGEHVPAALTFAKAGTVKIELTVAAIGARAPSSNTPEAAHAMPGMDHR